MTTIRDYLQHLKEKRSKQHKAAAVLFVLSVLVVSGVAWQMHLTGISMSGDTYCGQEEHQHTGKCREKQLVCGKEESGGHQHTEDCYKEEKKLVCGKEESAGHTHSEECYDADGNLTCGLEESEGHTHTDDCYKTEKVLVCSEKESEGHTHTDDCYKEVLVCDKEEHVHTLSCYSNPDADTETAKDWEKTVADVKLSGNWAEDLVKIAKTQLGYKESEKNYKVETDKNEKEVKKGYTRYGKWYGDTYGDWSAMFVSFCLNYADISARYVPRSADCVEWITELSDSDYGLYQKAGEYTPASGDLIFLDSDKDGKADQAGIVTEYTEKKEIRVILGDSEDEVQTRTYSEGDEKILGYARLPENPGTEEKSDSSDAPEADTEADDSGDASDNTQEEESSVSASVDDVDFTVTGKLPEGTRLVVNKLTDEQLAYIKENFEKVALGETTYAYDISLCDADGVKFEPDESVHVTVSGLDFPENTEVAGYHLADVDADNLTEADAKSVKVEQVDVTADETGLSYDADSFSPNLFTALTKSAAYKGYVSALTASITADGTAKFTDESESSTDGNDANDHNGVVRTFDTVEYQLVATFASLSDDEADSATEATLHFEMTLPMGITQAQFDLDKMSWIGSNYLIEYLDADGNVVGTKDSTCAEGEYIVDDAKTTINANASDSTNGGSSYQVSGIASQRITGTMNLKATESNPTVIPGTQTLSAGIKVLNAKNGDKVTPDFKVWLDDNTENFGYASSTADKKEDPTAQDTNRVSMNGSYDSNNKTGAVTVSAGALYNTELAQSSYLAYRSWFDFSTGKELTASSTETYTVGGGSVEASDVYNLLEALGTLTENYGRSDPSEYTNSEDNSTVTSLLGNHSLGDYRSIFSNIRYGRMYSYGIALQLANRDESGDYVMKGLSLPEGDITLDLQISANATSADEKVDTDQYYSILWDYKENESNADPGTQGRNLTWDNGNTNTRFARAAVPLNANEKGDGYGTTGNSDDYWGGTWSMTGINNKTGEKSSASTGNGAVYSFKVSGYDFDLDDYTFPKNRAFTSGSWAPYVNYEYNFSAGQAQVLSVFPRTNAGTVDVKQTLTVGNLSAKTLSGQTISKTDSKEKDTICYDYEINTAGPDNTITKGVTFYRPGSASRHSSFVKREGNSPSNTYLGQTGNTDTYWVTSYDSTAYVGDKIAIWGDCYLSDASDANITAFNLLQLFDSHAFSIDEDTSSKTTGNGLNGKTNYQDRIQILLRSGTYDEDNTGILYAADPEYKDGYNTNVNGVQEYMNSVREEDLVYYTSLSELEKAGYTCIGVLAEVRGCSGIRPGYDNGYCALRIPVKVNDEEGIVGTTVSTINTVRIWVNDNAMMKDDKSISWKDGKWDSSTGKNTLAGYQTITNFTSADNAGKGTGFDLNNGNGSKGYLKAEFSEGQIVSGTHKGGFLYGCTLMVLGYKAGITIDSEKKAGQKTYDLSQETGTVTYTLSKIRTELDSGAKSLQDNTTSLTIGLNLTGQDKNGKALSGENLDVELLEGCYSMSVNKENGEESLVKLSKDEKSPTTVYYRFVTTTDENKNTSTEIEFLFAPAKAGNNGLAANTEGRVEWTETKAMTLWVDSSSSDGKTAQVHIGGAPVGWMLPNVIAQAQLNDKLSNGDKIIATATIGGTGDNRAYDEVNGNYSVDTVSIVNLGASALTKTRDKRLTELNGDVTYTITYTNKGTADLTENLYLYDLLPYNGDIRGTSVDNVDAKTLLTGVSATVLDGSGKAAADLGDSGIKIYYSTEPQSTLRKKIEGFNGKDKAAINNMLNGEDFKPLGILNKTTKTLSVSDEVQSQITCIYAVATKLKAGYSLKLNLAMDTEGNAAADNYGNLAWAFVPGQGSELRTPIVQTKVVFRSISGVVWFDENLNGVRDKGEKLLDGVTCTLFKWNGDEGKYVQCTEDVTGGTIETLTDGEDYATTGTNGDYSFTKLSAGEYVVAFSLPDAYAKSVNGATTYQVHGGNDTNTNDGVALTTTEGSMDKEKIGFAGINSGTYGYAIAYNLTGTGNATPGNIGLHTLADYDKDSGLLKNYEENEEYQDLGLAYSQSYTLPEAGGTGTLPYIFSGLLLMAAPVVYGYERRRGGRGVKS